MVGLFLIMLGLFIFSMAKSVATLEQPEACKQHKWTHTLGGGMHCTVCKYKAGGE